VSFFNLFARKAITRVLRVYLPETLLDSGCSLEAICFFLKRFGSSESRVPDYKASGPFRLLSIPSGQLAQFDMI